jgi:hypothetical protein
MDMKITAIELAVRDLLDASADWKTLVIGPRTFNPEELPACSVVAGDVLAGDAKGQSMAVSCEIQVEAHASYEAGPNGEAPGLVARGLIGQIRAAVEVTDPALSGLLRSDDGASSKGRLGWIGFGIQPNRDGADGTVSVWVRYAAPHLVSFGAY